MTVFWFSKPPGASDLVSKSAVRGKYLGRYSEMRFILSGLGPVLTRSGA